MTPISTTGTDVYADGTFRSRHSALSVLPDIPDPDEENTNGFDPLVPRSIDLPTALPPGGKIDPGLGDIAKIFAAPEDPSKWASWRKDLATWRDEARDRLSYSGEIYEREETGWARKAYSVAQVWLWDERLFDHTKQEFTVDAFLEATKDFGGFDGIVLWHAYPIIGIDDRNQYDFYRDVPGLPEVINHLHQQGIRVFINYNPWDTGTRRPAGSDAEELVRLVGDLGVDGVFLDTLKEGDPDLTRALLSATPPQVLEGESRVPNQRIEDHQLSWAQWFADSTAPGVMRAHWFEPRHMMHSIRRWNRDHSSELQSAWMNGTGILVWDAVFGAWVGWNNRDKSTLRRMLRAQRVLTDLLTEGDWDPLLGASAEALEEGIYVSRFRHQSMTLWTAINRRDKDWTGDPLSEPLPAHSVRIDITSGRLAVETITIPGRSVAGILEISATKPIPTDIMNLIAEAQADTFSNDASFPTREVVRVVPPRAGATLEKLPKGAVVVEEGTHDVLTEFRRRETGHYQGAPYVEEWKPLPPRLHDHRSRNLRVTLPNPVAVGKHEVSVKEFLEFIAVTGYQPLNKSQYLIANYDPEAPVTGVSLTDARAYAVWKQARLPNEFEWQLAAEQPGFMRREPAVWNWTESEHHDRITRFVMLKGGSEHRSQGSDWYADGGVRQPAFSLKLLLAGQGVERSSNISFRLAWDLEPTT